MKIAAWRSRFAWLVAAAVFACAALPVLAAEKDSAVAGKDAYKQLPLRRDADESGGMGWAALAVVAALGAFAFVASARLRNKGRAWPLADFGAAALLRGHGQRVEIVERRSVSAACTVCLVRWNDEEVLLGCTAQSVSVISRRPVAASQQVPG